MHLVPRAPAESCLWQEQAGAVCLLIFYEAAGLSIPEFSILAALSE